jgi:hypothetical protein
MFYGNARAPLTHVKLMNGSIFVLGHNGKDGIVTELSPYEMFK